MDSSTQDISGSALKGVVQNGLVEVFSLQGAASLTNLGNATKLQTGKTDSSGNFKLSIPTTSLGTAPVAVRISRLDATSMLICDAKPDCGPGTSFGNAYAMPADLEMLTLLPNVIASRSISVNPLTTVAAQRAQERLPADGSAAAAIRNGSSEVSRLFGGIDIATVKPVDITKSAAVSAATPDELASALLISGLLASANGDATKAVTTLNNNFKGGKISASNLNALLNAARTQQTRNDLPESSSAFETIEVAIENANGGTVDPEPTSTAETNATDKGKKLVKDIRNFSQSIEDLGKPEEAFGETLDSSTQGYDVVAEGLGQSIGKAVVAMADCYERLVDEEATTVNCNSTGRTVSASKSNDGKTATLSADVNEDGYRSILSGSLPFDAQASTAQTLIASISGSATGGQDAKQGKLTIGSDSRLTLVKKTATALDPEKTNEITSAMVAAVDRISLVTSGKLEQTGVASPVTLTGNFALTLLGCAKCGLEDVTYDDGSGGEGTPGLNLSLFDLSGVISKGSESNSVGLRITQTDASARAYDTSKDYSSTNFINGTVSLRANAKLASQPDTTVVITVASTGYDDARERPKGTVDVTLTSAQSVLKIAASGAENTDDDAINVRVTSPNNTQAVFTYFPKVEDNTGVIGNITSEGTVIANIERRANGLVIVKYPDGSFETLAQ